MEEEGAVRVGRGKKWIWKGGEVMERTGKWQRLGCKRHKFTGLGWNEGRNENRERIRVS